MSSTSRRHVCISKARVQPPLDEIFIILFGATRFKKTSKKHERDDYVYTPQPDFSFPSLPRIEIAAYQIALRWLHLLFLVLPCRPIGFQRDNDSPIRFSLDATAEVAEAGNPNSLKDRVVIFG